MALYFTRVVEKWCVKKLNNQGRYIEKELSACRAKSNKNSNRDPLNFPSLFSSINLNISQKKPLENQDAAS